METQTDLTAEQINQMEKELEYQRKLLYQGGLEIDKLEKELTKQQGEVENLKKEAMKENLNEDEKIVFDYLSDPNTFRILDDRNTLLNVKTYLREGKHPSNNSL